MHYTFGASIGPASTAVAAAAASLGIKRGTTKDHCEGNEERQKRQRVLAAETTKPLAATAAVSSAQAAVRARLRVKIAQQQNGLQPKRPAWNQHQPTTTNANTVKHVPPPPSAKPKQAILKSAVKPVVNTIPQHSHNLRDSTKQQPSISSVAVSAVSHKRVSTTTSVSINVSSNTAMEFDSHFPHAHHKHHHPATHTTIATSTRSTVKNTHKVAVAEKLHIPVFNPRLANPEPAEDPLLVSEYSEEIFAYMRQMELKTIPNAKYMASQPGITWDMRKMLVDWLLTLHQKLRLLPETLFLTINLMDRFMSLKTVSVEKFQLVGVTAMFIACKYEEVMVPSVQVMVHMVEGGYSCDEILKAERFMLGLLKFGIGYNGPCSFLKRGLLAEKVVDMRCTLLARYFCEVSLLDQLFVAAPGSLVAAAAIYLGRKILGSGDWTQQHVVYTGYTEDCLIDCAKALYNSVSLIGVDAGVYIKYSDAKYSHVATFVKEFTLKNIAT
ncbi:UNVERIFIED_CONTAM: hypothetical protein HDU68_005070 [Siphonaria sp. JEL0065]|nr:hypothetical protein HDU68_005070 [Siphonaria sp. JEL0065]